jgi:hypothetical protein
MGYQQLLGTALGGCIHTGSQKGFVCGNKGNSLHDILHGSLQKVLCAYYIGLYVFARIMLCQGYMLESSRMYNFMTRVLGKQLPYAARIAYIAQFKVKMWVALAWVSLLQV